MVAGRFVLLYIGENREFVDEPGYVTSWDTWEEAAMAWPLERGYRLEDCETGRIWHPGTRHEWEDAQT